MNRELLQRIKTLPSFAQDNLSEIYATDAVIKIRENFLDDDGDKTEDLKNIIGLITLKDIVIEDLLKTIQIEFFLDDKDAKEIALIILREIFFPIKDFFPGIENEIIKLGGEVPKTSPKRLSEQLLKRDEEIQKIKEEKKRKIKEAMKDTIITDTLENLMKKYPEIGKHIIGSQDSIKLKNIPVPMKPMIKYWIEDYRSKTGYGKHSNIDRVQYVYHDANTRAMNEEERRQLNFILKASDGILDLPFSTKTKKIDFSIIEEE